MNTTMMVVINIAIMAAIVFMLVSMQKKYVPFNKRVFLALGLGLVFGLGLQFIFGSDSEVVKQSTSWFNIMGTGYVKLLKMVVVPLVMVSIISALVSTKSSKDLGKKAGLIIGILILTTGISAAVGIGVTSVFNLTAEEIQVGEVEEERGAYLEERLTSVQETDFPTRMLDMVPENPFLDMTGARATSTISVVIFSAFIGVATNQIKKKKPEKAELFIDMVGACQAVVMRIVTLVLRLTPYGVLALITNTVAKTNIAGIVSLGKFILASYVAIGLMFVIHLLMIYFAGYNPITYIKKALPVLTFAFTSRSSAGALTMNIKTQTDKLGVSEELASLSGSFGVTMGQNGCAGIYPAMLAVMIAPVVGINPLDPGFVIQLIVIIAVSSFGVAGVGGGATFAALLVLSSMNLPVALAGLLISVEPLIDMARTALNVNGSLTAGLVAGRVFDEVDKNKFNAAINNSEEDDMNG